MKVDRDDAPEHIRGKRKTPIGLAGITTAGLILGLMFMADRNGWIDFAKHMINPPQNSIINPIEKEPFASIEKKPHRPIAETVEDPYLEQVNRMLGITDDHAPTSTAEIEWTEPKPVQPPKAQQNVFTDSNYTPPATVNTIRMPRPQPQPVQPQQRKQPYVTVVKETKLSCWPFKDGSTECRRHKAQMHGIWRKNCDTGGNSQSHSCRMAKRYDLR